MTRTAKNRHGKEEEKEKRAQIERKKYSMLNKIKHNFMPKQQTH